MGAISFAVQPLGCLPTKIIGKDYGQKAGTDSNEVHYADDETFFRVRPRVPGVIHVHHDRDNRQ